MLAAAAAALTGCFIGGSTTIQQTPSTPTGGGTPGLSSGSTTMVAKGPTDVTENITQLVTKDYNQFEPSSIHIECPANEPSPPNYPVNCTFSAIDTSKLSQRNKPDGQHRPVSGALSIVGVYPPTQTYIFQLNYSPNFTQKPGYKPPKPPKNKKK
jgi:hypothetical protein